MTQRKRRVRKGATDTVVFKLLCSSGTISYKCHSERLTEYSNVLLKPSEELFDILRNVPTCFLVQSYRRISYL